MTPARGSGRDDRPDRSGRKAAAILLVLFLLASGTAVGGGLYYKRCGEASGPRTPVSLEISEGSSGDAVVALLVDRNVIRCGGIAGRLLMQNTGQASRIRAGTYDLTTNMRLDDVMAIITAAPVSMPTANLTVIPGQRMTDVAATVQQVLGIPAKAFLHAAESGSYALPPYLPKRSPNVEGFLWPETYRFVKKGVKAPDVVQRLLDQFSTDAAGLPWKNTKALGVSDYQAVVIASMIEKEVLAPEDRALVASVIYNRLAINMKLGFDTTVAYIDPDPSNGLTVSDFLIDSPFNTRQHPGIPPTPIASPSIESLQAALSPAKTDYRYFLQCPNETRLRFSVAYSDFLRDKACLG